MKPFVSSPVEATQVQSIAVSGFYGAESNYQPAVMTNALMIGFKNVRQKASVEATVGFIRTNYDSLFRKLAD
jgi:hypothetical protein